MNHDFDNEFETDDELKRGRSRRKEGRKYPSSGRTGRTSGTDSTGRSIGRGSTGRGSRTAAGAGKSRLRTIIIFIVAEIIARLNSCLFIMLLMYRPLINIAGTKREISIPL